MINPFVISVLHAPGGIGGAGGEEEEKYDSAHADKLRNVGGCGNPEKFTYSRLTYSRIVLSLPYGNSETYWG